MTTICLSVWVGGFRWLSRCGGVCVLSIIGRNDRIHAAASGGEHVLLAAMVTVRYIQQLSAVA